MTLLDDPRDRSTDYQWLGNMNYARMDVHSDLLADDVLESLNQYNE